MTRIITDAHVAATARVAARILDDEGWCQGDYTKAEGEQPGRCRLCLLAAISLAAGGRPDEWELRAETPDDAFVHGLMQRVAVAVGVHVGVFRPGEIPMEEDLPTRLGDGWNDDPVRTADQVIRALREAADDVEVAA